MSDKKQNLPNQTKNTPDNLSDGKNSRQNEVSNKIMLLSNHNWRCPTKLLILSNKYLFNKSFLINKLQYPKYTFFQKYFYRKTLQIYNSKWFIFTPSSANKQKHWIQNNLIFSIWEQFLIPLEKARMTLSFMIFWNTSTD